MPRYEYKVLPAPTKGTKAKGIKTAEGRFALSVEDVLNQMGSDGWDYLRAELLPSDERTGLTGSTTNWRNVLVFRRISGADMDALQPRLLDAVGSAEPGAAKPQSDPKPTPNLETRPEPVAVPSVRVDPPLATGAERMLRDNGVEEVSDVSGMTTSLKTRAAQRSKDMHDYEPEDDSKI